MKILALNALFFLSGAVALAYEIAWTRRLTLFFGSDAIAMAIILALFLSGLAAGALLIGRRVETASSSPLGLYALLEIGAGLLALGMPLLLPAIERVLNAALLGGWLDPALRVAAVALCVGPPTLLLGGTLPALARVLSAERGGWQLAVLYGSNTLGASCGALVASFVLLPRLGQERVSIVLPVASFVIGAVALLMARARWVEAPRPDLSSTTAGAGWFRGTELLGFASGFLVLAMEVGAARLIAIAVSQSVYGFAIMLASCIVGLAIGGYLASLLRSVRDRRELASLVGGALVVGGAGIAFLPSALSSLARLLAAILVPGDGSAPSFASWASLATVAAAAIMLPATVPLGVVFPTLLRMAMGTADRGRAVGRLYAWNTAGAVLGACGGGILLMPSLGPSYLLAVLAAAAVALGLLLVLRLGVAPRWLLLPAMAAVPGVVLGGDVDPELLTRSPAVYARHRDDTDRSERELELVVHDSTATIAVARNIKRGQVPYRFFSINGKIDGGESPVDMPTQVQLATWPLTLFARGLESARTALVIGLGTGTTVGEALTFPLHTIDVVEISRPMVAVARDYFRAINRGALDDRRVRVLIRDGRRQLAAGGEAYDVIISEPSNPWIAGIGALYTTEAFSLMRARLRAGGVACQWVQAYDLTEDLFRTIVATFAGVFPECYLVMPVRSDVLMLGFRDGSTEPFAAAQLDAALARRSLASEYRGYTPENVLQLASYFLMGPRGVAGYVAHATQNTDDNGLIEFGAPHALIAPTAGLSTFAALEPLIEPFTNYLAMTPDQEAQIVDVARSAAFGYRLAIAADLRVEVLRRTPVFNATAQRAALKLSEGFAAEVGDCSLRQHVLGLLAQYVLDPGRSAMVRFAPGWRREESITHLRRAVESSTAPVLAYLDLADLFERSPSGERYAKGADFAAAESAYAQVLTRDPRNREALLGLAALHAKQGDLAAAYVQLVSETTRADADPDVIALAGMLLLQQGALEQSRLLLERASLAHPEHTGLLRARAHGMVEAGDRRGARALLERVLEIDASDVAAQRDLRALDVQRALDVK